MDSLTTGCLYKNKCACYPKALPLPRLFLPAGSKIYLNQEHSITILALASLASQAKGLSSTVLFSTLYRYTDSEWLSSYRIVYRQDLIQSKFLIQINFSVHIISTSYSCNSLIFQPCWQSSATAVAWGHWSGTSPAAFPPRQQPGIPLMLLEKPQLLLPIILVLGSRHDHLLCLSPRHFSSSVGSSTGKWLI